MNLAEQVAGFHQIFLDTAPVIYFVEQNPVFAKKLQPVFEKLDNGELAAVVSPITLAECLVLPYRQGNPDLAQVFIDLLVHNDTVWLYPIDDVTADQAAKLRASYHLTLLDSLQIAVAIQAGCGAFLTNDLALSKVNEIPIIIISDAQ